MFASSDFATDPALAGIAESLGALLAESRADWSTPARAGRVVELGAAVEALSAELVRAVAAFDAAGDHAADGALSATAWIAHRVPMTRAAASRLVATARMTRRSEPLADALAAGTTTVSHVEQIARVVHKREDIFESHGEALVNAALAVAPEAFRTCAAAWRSNVDDLIGEVDDSFDASRDELTLSPTTGGLGIIGWFHTAAGIEIQNLIDSYDEPNPQNGERPPRTLAERRAAALYALLFDGRAAAPKNIDITIDEATYRGQRSRQLRARLPSPSPDAGPWLDPRPGSRRRLDIRSTQDRAPPEVRYHPVADPQRAEPRTPAYV